MTEEQTMGAASTGSQSIIAIDPVQEPLERFLESANVERVYGESIIHGDTTIIPAAEILVALGFGAGSGAGTDEEGQSGVGSGGGGGGRTLSRPVAVIVANSDGVKVEPVVDPTKIVLAGITAAGFMLATLLRMTSRKPALPGPERKLG